MLDKNNSLLIAVSDEECASVSGGNTTGFTATNGITFDVNGNLQLNTTINGSLLGSGFTNTSTISFSPNSVATVQGTTSTTQNPQEVVAYSFQGFYPSSN